MAAGRLDPNLTQWYAYCEYCEAMRTHQGDYQQTVVNDNGVWIHTVLLCPACDSPILVVQEPYPDGDLSDPSQLYPAGRGQAIHGTPRSVSLSFMEAVQSFERANSYTGSVLLCRRTLETICQEHGTKGDNLKKDLDALAASGVIDARLLEWATELRLLGNEAAHARLPIKRQDAEDALEFTEAMLSYIYTYRKSFELFKRRRDDDKKQP